MRAAMRGDPRSLSSLYRHASPRITKHSSLAPLARPPNRGETSPTKTTQRTVLKYRKKGVWTNSDRMDRMLFRFMLSTAA